MSKDRKRKIKDSQRWNVSHSNYYHNNSFYSIPTTVGDKEDTQVVKTLEAAYKKCEGKIKPIWCCESDFDI